MGMCSEAEWSTGGVPASTPGELRAGGERAVSLKHQSEQEGGVCSGRCVRASETEEVVHNVYINSATLAGNI